MSVKLKISGLSDCDKQLIKTLITTCDNEDVDVFDVVKEPSGRYAILPFSFANSFICKP